MMKNSAGCSRRDVLRGLLAGATLAAFPDAPLLASVKSLREYAAEKGILFGSAISPVVFSDKDYAALIASQCAIVVPENSLKWQALRPSPERYDFSGADSLYEFAHSRQILFRGHTLVWEQALPHWFGAEVNSGNAERMMVDHISRVMRHYAGKIHSWDVVNEAFQIEDGRPDGLKNTPWLRFMGPEYIETAFRAAHQADSRALLVYNENWLEPEDAITERKRQAVLALLTNLKGKNVPIHALGIQSHIYAETNVAGPNYRRFLEQIADLGLAIFITEMDIRQKKPPADLDARDRSIAKQYYDYLSFVLSLRTVKAVLTWGLSDRYTWIDWNNPSPDGTPIRPLPYDSEFLPTPAWDAIRRALESAPAR